MPDWKARIRELRGEGLSDDDIVERIRAEAATSAITSMPDDERRAQQESAAGLAPIIRGVGDFARGSLGFTRDVLTHPIETARQAISGVAQSGLAMVRGIPEVAGEISERVGAPRTAARLRGWSGALGDVATQQLEAAGAPEGAAQVLPFMAGYVAPYIAAGAAGGATLPAQVAAGAIPDFLGAASAPENSLSGLGAEYLPEGRLKGLAETAAASPIARGAVDVAFGAGLAGIPVAVQHGPAAARAVGRSLAGVVGSEAGATISPRVSGQVESGMSGRWFSRLQRSIEEAPQGRAPASQWLGMIRNAKGGQAGTELEWTGIENALTARGSDNLTRSEVLALARENEIRLTETVRRQNAEHPGPDTPRWVLTREGSVRSGPFATREEAAAARRRFPDAMEYDVAEMQVPRRPEAPDKATYAGSTLAGRGVEPDANYREILIRLDNKDLNRRAFTGGHWPDPDIIASARVTDEVGETGEKVLRVREIQSDIHQKGRSTGYGDVPAVAIRGQGSLPPDAPFKRTEEWSGLAVRRVIQEAAEGGYDRVIFPSADEQLYQYGTQEVTWTRRPDGAFDVDVYPQVRGDTMGHNLEDLADEQGATPIKGGLVRSAEELQETLSESGAEGVEGLGDKLWKRMQAEPTGTSRPREEGMRAFYDERIVPKVVQKEARRLGAVVERIPSPDAQLIPTRDWAVFGTKTDAPEYARFQTEKEAREFATGYALPPGYHYGSIKRPDLGVGRVTTTVLDEAGEVVAKDINHRQAMLTAANTDAEFGAAFDEFYGPLKRGGVDPRASGAFAELDYGQSRRMGPHWSIRITPAARDKILNEGQRIGAVPRVTGMAATKVGEAAFGATVGAGAAGGEEGGFTADQGALAGAAASLVGVPALRRVLSGLPDAGLSAQARAGRAVPFTVTHENVSEGVHGLFRAISPEHRGALTSRIEQAFEGGESGDIVVDMINRFGGARMKVQRAPGRGSYNGQTSPNVLLTLEDAERETVKQVMALRGILTGQDAEAAFRATDMAPTRHWDEAVAQAGDDKYPGLVIQGDPERVLEALARRGIDGTADLASGQVYAIDFGRTGAAFPERVGAALEGIQFTGAHPHVFEGIYLPRSAYSSAAGSAGALEELAGVLDERIAPAYRGLAEELGIDASKDLASLGELSRGLRAAPGEARWWLPAGAEKLKGGAATARAVDLVPRVPVDDPVARIASQLAVKRGKVGQRELLAAAGGDSKLAGQVEKFFLSRVGEMAKDLPLPTKERLAEVLQMGRGGASFYDVRQGVEQALGPEDADMFLRFYAATSPNAEATGSNLTFAAKAYAQWKLGLEFTGFQSAAVKDMLRQAAGGQVFGSRKVQQFYRALMGDEDAYVHDMWMARLFGFPEAATESQYRYAEEVIRQVARESDMSVRETQAAMWAGMKRWWQQAGRGRVTDVADFPTFLRGAITEPAQLPKGAKPWADRSIVGRWGSLDAESKSAIRNTLAAEQSAYLEKYGPRAGHADMAVVRMLVSAGAGGTAGAAVDDKNRLRGFAVGAAAGAAGSLLIPSALKHLVEYGTSGHLVTPAKGTKAGLELGSWWSETTGKPLAEWNGLTKAEQDYQIVQLARAERDLNLGGPGTVLGGTGPTIAERGPGLPTTLEERRRANVLIPGMRLKGTEGFAAKPLLGMVVQAGAGATAGAAVAPEDHELLGATTGGILALVGGAALRGEGDTLSRLMSWRKAGMLSSPSTTVMNVTSTGTMVAAEALKDAPAAAWDWAMSGLSGVRSKSGLSASTLKASWDAVGDAVEQARKVWKEGESAADMAKWDQQRITFENPAVQAMHDAVYRVLGAQDRFFHTVAVARSLQEQANVIAREAFAGRPSIQGMMARSPEFSSASELASWLQKNPTSDMAMRAESDAALAVFRNQDGLLANSAKKLREAFKEAGPEAEAVFDLFLPFTTTPANVVSRVAEYSPLGFLGAVRDASELTKLVKEGGANLSAVFDKQRKVSDRLGRATLGTGVIALGAWLAQKKLISPGYPESARDRNIQRITDKQPGSIRLFGKDYAIERLAPFGPLLVMGAELYQGAQRGGPTGAVSGAADYLGRNVTNESFLGDIDVALGLLTGEGTLGDRAAQLGSDVAASFVPNVVRRGLAGYDPTVREVRDPNVMEPATLLDRARTAIPGFRQGMPARVDPLGETVVRGTGGVAGAALSLFNPFTGQADLSDSDPLRELIETTGASIPSAEPSIRNLRRNGQPVEKGTPEFEKLARAYGVFVRRDLERVQQTGMELTIAGEGKHVDWDEASPDEKRRMLEQAAENARANVGRLLLETGIYTR